MMTQRIFSVALGVLMAIALSACPGGDGDSILPPAPGGSLPPASGYRYDYVVGKFCIIQERIIGLEAKILSQDLPADEKIQLLTEARKLAAGTIGDLQKGGRPDMVPPVRKWVNSFGKSIALARKDADGLDTLRPAIEALHGIEKVQTCELDND